MFGLGRANQFGYLKKVFLKTFQETVLEFHFSCSGWLVSLDKRSLHLCGVQYMEVGNGISSN